LKLDRNPYLSGDYEYFDKRREQNIFAKFRAAVYRKYKQHCPKCGESLHNGEPIELHHVVPRKKGGGYKMDNIQPLHQICHQNVTHRKEATRTETGRGKDKKKLTGRERTAETSR